MQVGEEHLARTEHLALVGLRLLHLHHELRALEDLRGARRDGRPGGTVLSVVDSDAVARAALDQHFVTVQGELPHARRHEADAVFVHLDLTRNADAHTEIPELRY